MDDITPWFTFSSMEGLLLDDEVEALWGDLTYENYGLINDYDRDFTTPTGTVIPYIRIVDTNLAFSTLSSYGVKLSNSQMKNSMGKI